VPKWTPDGTQIVCKLRPRELSTSCQPEPTPTDKSDDSMVQVWEHIPDAEEKQEERENKESCLLISSWYDWYLADIAAVAVTSGEVRRLTSGLRPSGIDISPDGRFAASLSLAGTESLGAQQNLYDHWHGFWSYENVVDYWQRVIRWFDELLLGKGPIRC